MYRVRYSTGKWKLSHQAIAGGPLRKSVPTQPTNNLAFDAASDCR